MWWEDGGDELRRNLFSNAADFQTKPVASGQGMDEGAPPIPYIAEHASSDLLAFCAVFMYSLSFFFFRLFAAADWL